MKVVASAPGKVILFGEHAVVHGVTAVAAALSDLRIFVELTKIEKCELAITLHDIQTASGQDFSIVLPFLVVKEVSQLRSESINPTPEVLAALNRIIKVDIDSAAQGIMATVFLVSHILHQYVQSSGSNPSGLDVRVKSVGLPIGAGLGSSAAFSVALSGALVRFRNLLSIDSNSNSETPSTKRLKWDYNISESKCVLPTDAPFIIPDEACLSEINKYAFAAEVVIHGTPSGLDNTTSCYGGALKFSKRVGASFDKLASLPPIHILLTNTRVPRKTSILVGKVGSLLQSFPSVVKPIFDSIEAIVQRFLVMTDSSVPNNVLDFEAEMASLITVNQGLLHALGVSHPALSKIIDAAQARGLSAKLTGAGGGGCALTLIPVSQVSAGVATSLSTDLEAHGFDSALSTLGGVGVKWHS